MATQLIAELGTCWNPNDAEASIARAIDKAAGAGADYVKLQDWSPITQMRRPDEWKTRAGPWTLNGALLDAASERAAVRGIGFFCSVFTRAAVQRAWFYEYPFVKVASSEAANDALLRDIVEEGIRVPVLVSFGEVSDLWRQVLTIATLNATTEVVPMVCVAEYPTPWEKAQEKARRLACYDSLNLRAGWSSHVAGAKAAEVAQFAVDHGAAFVEAHFNGGEGAGAPDFGPWSLCPDEFEALAKAVK